MNKKDIDKLIEILRTHYWRIKNSWGDSPSTIEELNTIDELCIKVEKLRNIK